MPFPRCTHPIIIDDGTFVGELCHICAAEEGGERFEPTQSNEDRRHFDNLMLMCHDHHVLTNNVTEYPKELLRQMKADHESRFESGLASMIEAASFQITNSTISLGGEGGKASGAGGGGGGAVGPQSQGGRGGNGGCQFFLSDTGEKQQLEDLHTPKWAKEFLESTRALLVDNPGAGGGGQGAIGVGVRGGNGGHGGDTVVGSLYLEAGSYRVVVGKGGKPAKLPGQHSFPGTASKIIAPDGTVMAEVEGARRVRSASSYLPDGVRELSETDVLADFKIVVFAPCNSMEIREGLIYGNGIGWEYFDISCIPSEAVWTVACTVQLPATRDRIGFYVALLNPSGSEVACQAITAPLENRTLHFRITIGALFDAVGIWRLVAYSGGYILTDYVVHVRSPRSSV